ncbi:hypothetical protein ACVGVM_10275 [Pseudonocardia bannensis]|uniref:Uncharacterized protein n=1 Tax=Pseudonocardia bannensis TaxID=630973 RepID=A0A848DHM0_9PSEU|nr:hypothetical protein [Pseudonocardia bannensis]NMH92049.1 hypothetical protein [Pseudonocardia bannensis]
MVVGVEHPHSDAAALDVAFTDARRHRTPLVVIHARHGVGPFSEHVIGRDAEAQAETLPQLTEAMAPWRDRTHRHERGGLR